MSKVIIAFCLLIFSFSMTMFLFCHLENLACYKKKKYIIRNKTYQIYGIKECERSWRILMPITIGRVILLLLCLIWVCTTFS